MQWPVYQLSQCVAHVCLHATPALLALSAAALCLRLPFLPLCCMLPVAVRELRMFHAVAWILPLSFLCVRNITALAYGGAQPSSFIAHGRAVARQARPFRSLFLHNACLHVPAAAGLRHSHMAVLRVSWLR